jgi:hypothetical protein
MLQCTHNVGEVRENNRSMTFRVWTRREVLMIGTNGFVPESHKLLLTTYAIPNRIGRARC